MVRVTPDTYLLMLATMIAINAVQLLDGIPGVSPHAGSVPGCGLELGHVHAFQSYAQSYNVQLELHLIQRPSPMVQIRYIHR